MMWWKNFLAESDDLNKIRETVTTNDKSKETKYSIACVGKCSPAHSCHWALMVCQAWLEALGTLRRTKQNPPPPGTHILVKKRENCQADSVISSKDNSYREK